MRYLGIDVHSTASVWCLLDEDGRPLSTGRCETAFDSLQALARELAGEGDGLLAGQEVGNQVYLVHDTFEAAGVSI